MKVLKVSVQIQNTEEVSRWETKQITIALTPDEITMRQWTDFWIAKMAMPDTFNSIDSMTVEERTKYFASFDEMKWVEFASNCLMLLSCVVDGSEGKTLLRNLPILDKTDDGILVLYFELLSNIAQYEPKNREGFTHKGEKFVFPKATTDSVGREWFGSEITAGEAFEALQCAHILNAKNEFGEYVLNDRKYHTDIAMLATLARRVDENGNIEVTPVETLAMRHFFEHRIKFFSNVPMSVALDMAFFLKSSKLAYMNTLTSRLLTNRLQVALKM